MTPNPLPAHNSPLASSHNNNNNNKGGRLMQRSLPLQTKAAVLETPTLQALLRQSETTAHNNSMPPLFPDLKGEKNQAADIAAEALRISRESLRQDLQALLPKGDLPKAAPSRQVVSSGGGGCRLNKFVRRLHDMLQAEKDKGIIEWRKGLLVLHSTAEFAKNILPKFFNTKNFKTFRRQLNYYGFVHVRSFSTAAASTTALWVNQELAESGSADISSVLTLKRVEPCDLQKTAEGRRQRKEMAMHTVEEDLKIDPKTLQLQQIQNLTRVATVPPKDLTSGHPPLPTVPLEIAFAPRQTPLVVDHYRHVVAPSRPTPVQHHHHHRHHATVVSDDTQSRASSSSSHASETAEDEMDDSLGAANLLLLLSRTRC